MRHLKKFYVKTYGCQMNELDSEVMSGILERRGLEKTESEAEADLLLYNTCSIRDLAERKALGTLGLLGKTEKKEAIIGVTGCMANAKKSSLFEKIPYLDFVLGTNNIHDLNAVLDEVLATGRQLSKTDEKFTYEIDYLAARRNHNVSAHVSIIRGCDKFCTYCVVPYTRGPEVSRKPHEIIEECKFLAAKGYKEITLLGQNVNSYGKDLSFPFLFHDLLYELDKIEGIERIRFMTSHPVDITFDLMLAIRDLPSLCEFVHFPVQAGSDRILKKMHRIYTKQEYLEKVAKLREFVPGISLGTDIIVGFPTETDAEFEETYALLEQIRYSVAFIFSYSPRKGTPAKRWKDDIPEEVKDARLKKLLQLQEKINHEQLTEMLGTEVEVLVEEKGQRGDGMLKGRTRCWKKVLFQGEESLVGTLQTIKLHSFTHTSLLGKAC